MFIVSLLKKVQALGLLYYPNGEAKNTYFLPRHRGSIEGQEMYYLNGEVKKSFCLAIGVVKKDRSNLFQQATTTGDTVRLYHNTNLHTL